MLPRADPLDTSTGVSRYIRGTGGSPDAWRGAPRGPGHQVLRAVVTVSRARIRLAITKTSGKLGTNQCHKGAWDRSEGLDEDEQQCRITAIALNLAVQTATYCSDATFLLDLSFQTIPSASAVLIPIQFPIRFRNGLLGSITFSGACTHPPLG